MSDANPAEAPATAKGAVTVVELSRAQQSVARRTAEAKAIVPEFTLQVDVDMEAAIAARAELRGDELVPTINDLVVKACALALRQTPRANGAYRDGRFELHERVNVGVAVAAPDTLVTVPIVDADTKPLAGIARDTRRLAARVRAGEITSAELSGATFTVSNLGMHGVDRFEAVVAPPQAAVLAVGAVAERAVVRDGAVVARHTMAITLACDHRILYGADAAAFLTRVRDLLQAPAALFA